MINSFRKIFFYRQHPDTALRYIPIINLLKKLKMEDSKILEVGSGSYGITPYLKKTVTGVDLEFHEPEFSFLKQVKGSALDIPFKANKFEVVILSDVLEHLDKKYRLKALNEAIRVTEKYLIVAGPFGELSAMQDQKLADYSMKKIGHIHPFFKDHLKYGLPEVDETIAMIKTNRKVIDMKMIGEFLNLSIREKLMKIFIAKNKLQFYFYLKGLMPVVPLLKLLNKKPGYRSIILVKV